MSDKSLTLDAAAEIDRYTQQSIAKINDNANALFSRIAEANERALKSTKDLEKLGNDNTQRFERASTAAAKMKAEIRKLEERKHSAGCVGGLAMTTETTPEIKPCPFCGSPAEFEYTPWNEDDQSGDDGSGKVECIKCFASISGYRDDAIEKWNTRVKPVSAN